MCYARRRNITDSLRKSNLTPPAGAPETPPPLTPRFEKFQIDPKKYQALCETLRNALEPTEGGAGVVDPIKVGRVLGQMTGKELAYLIQLGEVVRSGEWRLPVTLERMGQAEAAAVEAVTLDPDRMKQLVAAGQQVEEQIATNPEFQPIVGALAEIIRQAMEAVTPQLNALRVLPEIVQKAVVMGVAANLRKTLGWPGMPGEPFADVQWEETKFPLKLNLDPRQFARRATDL